MNAEGGVQDQDASGSNEEDDAEIVLEDPDWIADRDMDVYDECRNGEKFLFTFDGLQTYSKKKDIEITKDIVGKDDNNGYHAVKIDLTELHYGESEDIIFECLRHHKKICSLDIDLHYSCFTGGDYFLKNIPKLVEINEKCLILNITYIMDNLICSKFPRFAKEMQTKILEIKS